MTTLSPSLLFHWPKKERPRLSLWFFFFIALIFHLSTIYLIRIIYPRDGIEDFKQAAVFVFPQYSQDNNEMKVWLSQNDPAIFSPLATVSNSAYSAEEQMGQKSFFGDKIPHPLNPLPLGEHSLRAPLPYHAEELFDHIPL